MAELGWEDAIQRVLEQSDEPMHYKAIAEEIAKQELRVNIGATPANTVNAYINTSINSSGESSPYVRTTRGYYALRTTSQMREDSSELISEEEEASGLINSLGMFWKASEVVWKSNPKILGQQQVGSDTVDFCDQVGVYLLHDRARVVYVGRSVDRPMGQRLYEHTKDRLNGRWDRFSWFGLKAVSDSGELESVNLSGNDQDIVISTIEAVLIESLEPPQNRRRGDQLAVSEYLQVSDPEMERKKIEAITALISGTLVSGI